MVDGSAKPDGATSASATVVTTSSNSPQAPANNSSAAPSSNASPAANPAPEQPTVLGIIIGKSTTREFSFAIQSETKVFEYLKVHHRVFGDVLCQVLEITATLDDRIALCNIIGYRDPDGTIKSIRIPFDVGSRVLRADDDFINVVIKLADAHGALLGKLEGRSVPVHLDLRKILTKHVAVLAKSGAGKSYCVGVMIEEVLEKRVPILIIDPHGEYATLSQPNTAKEDAARLAWFGLTAKGYSVNEYGDPTVCSGQPLRLSNKMSQQELVQMIPTKLTGAQIGILYAALRNIDQVSIDAVIASLNSEESNAKWGLINILEHLRTYNIFSNDPTPYDDIISPGVCSIVNLRGIPSEIQSIIVYKLIKDLFELRKRGTVPPFFLVLEEAHNFCPERSFGETTASKTIRTIASEGRKFGLGLCVITQRPARLDKSVVSQCTTQIILKVTNPNDLKAISASVEGLTAEAEKEIANLPIGTALVTGIVEVPLLVNVRPRRSLHGGHAVDIFGEIDEAAKRPKLPRPVRSVEQAPQPMTQMSSPASPSASSGFTSRPSSASGQSSYATQSQATSSGSSESSFPASKSTVKRSKKNDGQVDGKNGDLNDDVDEKIGMSAQAAARSAPTGDQGHGSVVERNTRIDVERNTRMDVERNTGPGVERNATSVTTDATSSPASITPSQLSELYPGIARRPSSTQPIAVLKPRKGILEQLAKDKPLGKVHQLLIPAFLVVCQQGQEQFRLVVERIEGRIVTGIERFTTKRIPDLKHLAKEELKLLQDAYAKGTLSPTKEQQSSPTLQSLVQHGYLLQQPDGTLSLSEQYLFQKLSKVKSDDDLEFTRVTDAQLLDPQLNEMQVRMELSAFVAVKAVQECWVLRIDVK